MPDKAEGPIPATPNASSPSPTPLQKAKRAMADGEVELAEALLRDAIQTGNPKPDVWHLWIRTAIVQGRIDVAQARSAQAIEARPNAPMLRALDSRIEALAGNPKRALWRINQAIPRWPNNFRLRLQKFQILRDLGRTLPALKALRPLRKRWFDKAEVQMACANFYRAHGRLRAAKSVIDHLLKHHPEHRQARVMQLMQANTGMETGDKHTSALSALLTRAQNNLEVSSTDAVELLQAVKLTTQPELAVTCRESIEFLANHSSQLTELDKLALLNQAERFGLSVIANQTLAEIMLAGPRTAQVANALFRKALLSIDRHQVDAVSARLLQYIPESKHAFLAAQFALSVEGPKGALDKLREPRKCRTLPEAHNIIQILWAGNSYHFALRYLRFCRRRWPEDPELRLQHARFLRESGHPQEALEAIRGPIPPAKRMPFTRIRAHSLLEIGQAEAAKAVLERASHPHRSANGIRDLHLRILIMLGREEEAYAVIEEGQRKGPGNPMASGHFSVSQIGNLLNDLVLYRREQAALPPEKHDMLATNYVHAASSVIRRRFEDTPSPTTTAGTRLIPLRVGQYWNEKTPPQAVTEIMHSWSRRPGIEYKRFDSGEAKTFLRETFGQDYEQAFRLANNIAESADFFRLCYLRHYGGFYADADDYLYGKLSNLLPPDAGMVCFLEPFDVLANNALACVPNHPAIVLASEMAREALLGRDNDNTWGKTGPGLLTRAVAHYLIRTNTSTPKERIAILPAQVLRKEVQVHIALPHKKSKRHWNATHKTADIDMRKFITA
ncbi:glycosyltransferase [Salinicola corii]|nr:glycosyltransferase [Salinicola corii]